MRRIATPIICLLVLFPAGARAQMPSLRGAFKGIPCLAPIVRAIDPDAPKNIQEALVLPPYQAPRHLDNIGTLSFPVTVSVPEAQTWFDEGVALLHSFWYTEAERCFRRVVSLDPECPMAFWGLALANELHPARAAVYIQRAVALSSVRGDIPLRERNWITAYANFFSVMANPPAGAGGEKSETAARHRRVRALEEIAYAHPEDLEARAFLLRHVVLDHHRAGIPITSLFTADALAGSVHGANPRHPSGHYRTLLWLGEVPGRALSSAIEAVALTRAVPGSWRYAAQLFAAAGHFEDATRLYEGGLRTAHGQMRLDFTMPDDFENLASDYEALIEHLVSTGRIEEAISAATGLISLPRTAHLGNRVTLEQLSSSCYDTGRRLFAEALLRTEQWTRLLTEAETGILRPGSSWREQAYDRYWRALAHLHLGQVSEARELEKGIDAAFRAAMKEGIRLDVQAELAGLLKTFRFCAAVYEGKYETAPEPAALALPRIPRDQLARLLFHAGFDKEALALAEKDLAENPGEYLTVANYCDLHFRAGETGAALLRFNAAFRRSARAADAGLPIEKRLEPIIAHLKLRSNWKLPPTPPTADFSLLPPLADLGPWPWTPPGAPAFALSDHANQPVSLEEFRGRPLVVLFFNGVGCVYCAEQLTIFKPHAKAFARAGISILAVSTDSVAVLAGTAGADPGDPPPPTAPAQAYSFPILADDSLSAFKAFRVHDAFENKAMHATFLIDPEGRVLWNDIRHEPFLYPDFLLEEARRLLALHAPPAE